MQARDIVVETGDPASLDATVQQFGAAVVGAPDYVRLDDGYVVRVFGDPGFVKFAITQQGYGTIVRELPQLL